METVVVLHYLLRLRSQAIPSLVIDHEDDQHNLVPGTWRDEGVLEEVPQPSTSYRNTGGGDPKSQREYLVKYFNVGGAVPWQNQMVS